MPPATVVADGAAADGAGRERGRAVSAPGTGPVFVVSQSKEKREGGDIGGSAAAVSSVTWRSLE